MDGCRRDSHCPREFVGPAGPCGHWSLSFPVEPEVTLQHLLIGKQTRAKGEGIPPGDKPKVMQVGLGHLSSSSQPGLH